MNPEKHGQFYIMAAKENILILSDTYCIIRDKKTQCMWLPHLSKGEKKSQNLIIIKSGC